MGIKKFYSPCLKNKIDGLNVKKTRKGAEIKSAIKDWK